MNNFWRKNIGDPLAWLWQTCIKPVSYQKFIETLPEDEVKRRFKKTITLTFLVSFLLNIVSAYIATLSFSFKVDLLFFLILLVFIELVTLSEYQRVIKHRPLNWSKKLIETFTKISFYPFLYTAIWLIQSKTPSITAIVVGIVIGLLLGIDSSVKRDKSTKMLLGMIIALCGSITFGLSLSSFNIISLAITGLIFYAFSGLRLINWAKTAASIRAANRKSRREPHRATEFLQKCALWQDEFGTLPYPGLRELLRRAALHDWAATLPLLTELIKNHPQQSNVAKLVIIEVLTLDWTQRRTVLDIAGAEERLRTMLPDRTLLHNLHVQFIIDYLAEVSEHARKYCEKFGVEAALGELENMEYRLNTVSTRLAHEHVPGDKHLKRVVALWRTAVTSEIQRARTAQWQIIQ
jgi:hypothetical protein